MPKLKFSYDEVADVLTVEDIRFSGDVFRDLGGRLAIGQSFVVRSRDSGVLVLGTPSLSESSPAAPSIPPSVAPSFGGPPGAAIGWEIGSATGESLAPQRAIKGK